MGGGAGSGAPAAGGVEAEVAEAAEAAVDPAEDSAAGSEGGRGGAPAAASADGGTTVSAEKPPLGTAGDGTRSINRPSCTMTWPE